MKPKAQLKDRTVEWLAGHRGYGCTVLDMWRGASGLDAKASNAALWGQGNGKRHVDVRQALRARALELRMNPRGKREESAMGQVEQCPLCGEKGNWHHICATCKHVDIRDFYTVRHNATGKVLQEAVRGGKFAGSLIMASFGRTGDTPEDITVPDWMLPKDTKLEITGERIEWEGESVKCGINPDMIILHGWPATAAHPAGPVKSYKGRCVWLYVAEHACTSDLTSGRTARRKRAKYGKLMQALRGHGWNVQGEVIVTTVGVRGTVPKANDESLQALGVAGRRERGEAQARMAREAVRHLNRIVRQYRILAARAGKKTADGQPAERQGVG